MGSFNIKFLKLFIYGLCISTTITKSDLIPYVTNSEARYVNAGIQTDPVDKKRDYRDKLRNTSWKSVVNGGGNVLKTKSLDIILLLSGMINAHQEFIAGFNFNFPTSPMMLLGNIFGLFKVLFIMII